MKELGRRGEGAGIPKSVAKREGEKESVHIKRPKNYQKGYSVGLRVFRAWYQNVITEARGLDFLSVTQSAACEKKVHTSNPKGGVIIRQG